MNKQERKQAEMAIYGLQETMPTNQVLTQDEIERMRQLVAQNDREDTPKEFDINKPPQVPYSYQPFPKMMYHHERRIHRVAANKAEVDEALANGWSTEQYPPEAPTVSKFALEPAAPVEEEKPRRRRE